MSDSKFEWPRDMIPMDELDRRYSIMEDIRNRQRLARDKPDWNFTRLQLSVLKVLPFDDLESVGRLSASGLVPLFNDMNKLVRHFFHKKTKDVPDNQIIASTAPHSSQKPHPASRIPTPSAVASSSVPSKRTHEDSALAENKSAADDNAQQRPDKAKPKPRTKVDRNPTEKGKCLSRDEFECIVTKTLYPQVCHIVPFSWNNTESNRQTTESLMRLLAMCFGLTQTGTIDSSLSKLHAGLGTSDRPFNMVAMTATLHTWWDKGCFALKWLGATPSLRLGLTDIKLQFIWMPWSPVRDANQVVLLEDEKDERKCLLSGLNHFCGPQGPPSGCDPDCKDCAKVNKVPGIAHPHTAHSIESGTIIFVTRPSDMVEDFKVMIDIQYALVRVGAMSGAAQAPELLAPDDDDGDYGYPSRIWDWLRQIG
ncbi:hypothetical protein NM208_g11633 [Fusarium decemcellulare]|uniref:Uncharacterized protein n=1 Tax=Fusarium decemcellulare TaxID=57161 RepID=A0ACC1RRV7_9HYPO|nr:hypothetical protein NM208_g11633 [Fusarium decemcellulare]